MESLILYKYTTKNYADLMMAGKFYINTLNNLRNYEKEEIGDEGEGTVVTYEDNINLNSTSPSYLENSSEFVSKIFPKIFKLSGKGSIELKNCAFEEKSLSNCYLFCASKEFDVSVMKKMGYDTCLKIISPNYFFSEITSSLSHLNLLDNNIHFTDGSLKYIHGECSYGTDRREHYQDKLNISPILRKPSKFSYQKEIRFIWIPNREKKVNPEIIFCKKAADYLRKLDNR